MVNKIISHAQHILRAPAALLVLPPLALSTKKLVLCVFQASLEKTTFCQEPNKTGSFIWGQLKATKTTLCSISELISISMTT